jgi:hypothetical protein
MTDFTSMNMLTQNNNTGQYASVESLPFTERKITYNRGFGNVVVVHDKPNNQVATTITPFNRIQPLTGKFGDHAPRTADPEFRLLNPQTNIAWDNNPKYQ